MDVVAQFCTEFGYRFTCFGQDADLQVKVVPQVLEHTVVEGAGSGCGDGGLNFVRVAQALVDAGATTKPVAVVASILSAHTEGTALNRIASDLGIHHKTVSKIIDAAEIIGGTSSRCDGRRATKDHPRNPPRGPAVRIAG